VHTSRWRAARAATLTIQRLSPQHDDRCQVGLKGAFDCIKAFSETDLTEDLKRFDVPTLIAHGEDDQIVPIKAAAPISSKLVPGATLKVYPGAPHGLTRAAHEDEFNADLLAFISA
jgi:non-heme chloroperoxidase